MKFFQKRKSGRLVALAFGAMLATAACGGSTTATETSASNAGSASSVSSGTESSGNPLLAGSVGTVSGSQFDLGSLDGQDAILWFWAPW